MERETRDWEKQQHKIWQGLRSLHKGIQIHMYNKAMNRICTSEYIREFINTRKDIRS